MSAAGDYWSSVECTHDYSWIYIQIQVIKHSQVLNHFCTLTIICFSSQSPKPEANPYSLQEKTDLESLKDLGKGVVVGICGVQFKLLLDIPA